MLYLLHCDRTASHASLSDACCLVFKAIYWFKNCNSFPGHYQVQQQQSVNQI